MSCGVPVFSPIAHTHSIGKHLRHIDPADHDFWLRVDDPLMQAAHGMINLTAVSWEHSVGMAYERDYFRSAGKPIVYWQPGSKPPLTLLRLSG